MSLVAYHPWDLSSGHRHEEFHNSILFPFSVWVWIHHQSEEYFRSLLVTKEENGSIFPCKTTTHLPVTELMTGNSTKLGFIGPKTKTKKPYGDTAVKKRINAKFIYSF